MSLEFQNQISIQPQEESGGDTPVVEDIGTMYQSIGADGNTWSTYSEMTSNTVAELARLRPFGTTDTTLLDYWDYTGTLSLTVKFTYETSVNSAWYGNPFIIIYANGDGNYHSGVAHVENNQLRIAYTGAPTRQLTAGHTYTIKLSLNADTNNALLYCKEEGVDSDFVLVDSHTAISTASVTRAYIEIDNNITEGYQQPNHKFADFDLSNITIDIDGEVIFSRAKSGGGGGGSDFIGIPRELSNGVLQMPSGSYSLPSGVTTIDDYALYYAFYQASGLSNVNLSGLTTVNLCGLNMAFRETGLTNISFPNLTTIEESGCSNVCNRCTSLTSVSFPELTTVKLRGLENAFYNCTGLTSVTFDKLSNISADYVLSGCFTGCTSLTDVYLPALTTNSFGSSTNQFTFWLASVTNPKVHLPSNLSSVSGLTSKIQSNNGTVQVLYDLPATT